MRPLILLSLSLLSLACLGCNTEPRYQLVSMGDGPIYKIDTRTGQVWMIYKNLSYEVHEGQLPEASEGQGGE